MQTTTPNTKVQTVTNDSPSCRRPCAKPQEGHTNIGGSLKKGRATGILKEIRVGNKQRANDR